MNHVLVVAVLIVTASVPAAAQGTNIHNRLGQDGSHFSLPASTAIFNYEATISGFTSPIEIRLQVFHNGVLRHTTLDLVSSTGPSYQFASPVEMGSWGLCEGDVITFVLTVANKATGAVLATHSIYGEVGSP